MAILWLGCVVLSVFILWTALIVDKLCESMQKAPGEGVPLGPEGENLQVGYIAYSFVEEVALNEYLS